MNVGPKMIIGFTMVLIGFGLVFAAITWGLAIKREVKGWIPSVGRYECRLREQNDQLSLFRFSYMDSQGRSRYANAWTFFPGDLRLGDELPLLTNPCRDEVRVGRFGFLYARPLELAGGGIAMLVMSVLVLISASSR